MPELCEFCGRRVPTRMRGTGFCTLRCSKRQERWDRGSMESELQHVEERTTNPPASLELGAVYRVKIGRAWHSVRAVNGEEWFKELGLSHGFVHLADPYTGAKVAYCGTHWFEEHAVLFPEVTPRIDT